MNHKVDHIDVCICTYKRPALLAQLMRALVDQDTDGSFTYTVILVDNDDRKSAHGTYSDFKADSRLHIQYHVVQEQNISLARNKAVESATGDYVAFIDDDEYPGRNWLKTLLQALKLYSVDGILGPVIPVYEMEPPRWVLRGRFHERPTYTTGHFMKWQNTRTGNALIRRCIIDGEFQAFRPEFGRGGEDTDFFKRMMAKGHSFAWCAEAPVYEVVTPERCKRAFMLKRAILRGQNPNFTFLHLIRSLVAIPVYAAILPLLLLTGHHNFMKLMISECDHIGRVLAFCGIDLVKQRE